MNFPLIGCWLLCEADSGLIASCVPRHQHTRCRPLNIFIWGFSKGRLKDDSGYRENRANNSQECHIFHVSCRFSPLCMLSTTLTIYFMVIYHMRLNWSDNLSFIYNILLFSIINLCKAIESRGYRCNPTAISSNRHWEAPLIPSMFSHHLNSRSRPCCWKYFCTAHFVTQVACTPNVPFSGE